LGTSFGRGGATSFQQDLQHADVILIQGSNMAEAHPVGFQWVMEAKAQGATVIHVDPRFTRTSALADVHVPIRAGTDIAFLGGLVHHVLANDRAFLDYVVPYTNAATIIDDDYVDAEELGGVFSGFDAETGTYDPTSWQYAGGPAAPSAGAREQETSYGEVAGGLGGRHARDGQERDETLQHPRCVYQILKRHFARYTPEMVSETCGIRPELFTEVAALLCDNSGRERTGAFCYAVGWTHHSVGVQYIRTAAILQTLLGNIGRPGGGIMALRGHASIQGSTDIPTLYDILPGYIPMPHADHGETLDDYLAHDSAQTGYWGDMRAYVVSLLKAWWGDAATAGNDFAFGYLPRLTGDHSTYQSILGMLDGTVTGFFVLGENPAVGSGNSRLHRLAMAKLDWLVVRDLQETETAAFWYDAPEIETGELHTRDIATEVFLMPAAAHTEKDGSFTQTQRLLQWHDKAVEPMGDQRSELWFMYQLGRIIREKLARSDDERDRPVLDLTWAYPTSGVDEDPDAEAVLAEINGSDGDGRPLPSYTELRGDGSTRCGCWIYCGCRAEGVNQTRRRRPGSEQDWVAAEWGWAWPANRRILYNRASADPDGRPWSERRKYIWWDEDAQAWAGMDVPDFPAHTAPHHEPPPGARAEDALGGDDPFIMQSDGKAWLFVPAGLKDGPLPTHYEPFESPVANPLYRQQANPAIQQVEAEANPSNPSDGEPGAGAYPFVLTTYRLTEHHTAGAMSRSLGRLNALQPEMFCEVSPELATLRKLDNGGWATIVTARSAIEARVLVTPRMVPLRIRGELLHQVGVPFHWGRRGRSVGDSANDLLGLALDPNVHIQDTKALTCDVLPGRRPRGADLRAMVERHRRDAR
jgi:formate dehydrogenase major subunit